MSIFTQKFPQQLLQYLTLIRYAANVHSGLRWVIYDYKFRQKAGQNKTHVWSEIDQQLWMTIFTVAPLVLKEECPLFFPNDSKPIVSHLGPNMILDLGFKRL